jgi:molybdopterin synthase sulfur carrier subunit
MKLLYFAWLRAKLGKGSEELVLPPSVTTVGALLDWLETLGPTYKSVLADRRVVRVAVNLEYVGPEHPVAAGDEVALFPPVTGG